MKKILLLLSLFIAVKAFGQAPVSPVVINQATFYKDTNDGSIWNNFKIGANPSFWFQQVPNQSGQNGKFLGTNGTTLSWQTVSSGSGTVANISGVNTNGFTWSIANPTTTPAITLLLQNATTSQAGQLTATDWNAFNGKQAAITTGTAAQYFKGDLSLGTFPTSLPPSGTAGGDLTGTYPNPTVNTINSITKTFYDPTSSIQAQLNGKQATGNYLTALTGDGTASGPGSSAFTLATVNPNVGSFGSSTAIPVITYNGKGLATGVTTAAVIAPAATLSGTTLNPTVVNSSLTGVGTLVSGSIPYSLITGAPTIPIGANPTASAGTTAVNGSAPTFMRSDAAPKVDSTAFTTKALISTYLTKAQTLALGSVTSANNAWVIRDAQGIGYFNNIGEAYTTTVTTGGTTTLTIASTRLQYFTGTLAQTVTLPVVSTFPQDGIPFNLVELGTGTITVKSSGGNTVGTIMGGSRATVTNILTTGTTAASWDIGEPVVQANNGLTNAGGIVGLGGAIPVSAVETLSANASFSVQNISGTTGLNIDNSTGAQAAILAASDGTNTAVVNPDSQNGATLGYTNASGAQAFTLFGSSGITLSDYSAKNIVLANMNDALLVNASLIPKKYGDSVYAAKANGITTFTTTGSSGAATFSAGTLNIPNYTLTGLGGVPTTQTVAGFALSGPVTLAALTATNTSLTFSGSYTGATARTVGLNLANANSWSALQTFPASDISIAGTTISALSGSGGVLAETTSPTFVTPTLGAALATSINGVTITSTTGTVNVANSTTLGTNVNYTVKAVGTATLVAGTVTVSGLTGVTASSIASGVLKSRAGTTTTTWQYAFVPGTTSIVITSLTNTGTTNTSDTSTIYYTIVN